MASKQPMDSPKKGMVNARECTDKGNKQEKRNEKIHRKNRPPSRNRHQTAMTPTVPRFQFLSKQPLAYKNKHVPTIAAQTTPDPPTRTADDLALPLWLADDPEAEIDGDEPDAVDGVPEAPEEDPEALPGGGG